jgi:autoinducer 2-degrading protein
MMFSLWVTLEIRPECRQKFLAAIEANAQASVREEEGCYRFDMIELEAPGSNRFAFYELYRDEAAFEVEHKQAPHYLAFKEIAARAVVPGSQTNFVGTLVHSVTATD